MLADRTHSPWLLGWHLGRFAVRGLVTNPGWGGVPQESATLCELLLPHAVGQEAEVPQPMEAVRWDMQHQTPPELHSIKRQGAQVVAARVILGAAGHLAVLQGHETMVRDGHTVGRAGEVCEDLLRILEGLFRVDAPLRVAQGGEELLPRLGLGEPLTAPRQGELALAIELLAPRQGHPPKTPREDADGQEEVRPTRHPLGAIWR